MIAELPPPVYSMDFILPDATSPICFCPLRVTDQEFTVCHVKDHDGKVTYFFRHSDEWYRRCRISPVVGGSVTPLSLAPSEERGNYIAPWSAVGSLGDIPGVGDACDDPNCQHKKKKPMPTTPIPGTFVLFASVMGILARFIR